MRGGEEIQAALRAFAQRWRDHTGTERAEAQTFLNQLLECYGVDRQAAGIEFEKRTTDLGFMDLYWPQWCIVEMKAPSRAERLSTHYQQVRDYWEASADDVAGTPAARFVVLGAFHRFEIWEPGRFPRSPRVIVDLQDLPDRYDASGQGSCCGILRNAGSASPRCTTPWTTAHGPILPHCIASSTRASRCYGWPVSVAQDDAELVRRLSALNTEIAAGRAVRALRRLIS